MHGRLRTPEPLPNVYPEAGDHIATKVRNFNSNSIRFNADISIAPMFGLTRLKCGFILFWMTLTSTITVHSND